MILFGVVEVGGGDGGALNMEIRSNVPARLDKEELPNDERVVRAASGWSRSISHITLQGGFHQLPPDTTGRIDQ